MLLKRSLIYWCMLTLASMPLYTDVVNGLAPEVTDLNAKDISYHNEFQMKYLSEGFVSTKPQNMDDGLMTWQLNIDSHAGKAVLDFAKQIEKATDDSLKFPKHVTVDLESAQEISRVRFGVPAFGSTKTIVASISLDGRNFKDIGKRVFLQNQSQEQTIDIEQQNARYVRLTYLDHYNKTVKFAKGFSFTTELEIY